MNLQNFTGAQLVPFWIGAILLIFSVCLFHSRRERISVFFLFGGSLAMGFFVAHLDPFLWIWDEQYHALVAKHMVNHPFRPMLYSDSPLRLDSTSWVDAQVWLHKQPLFLWQMALSIRIFGNNEMAVRLPSIILHAFAVLAVYRIGKISVNKNAGFYGALFFAISWYLLEMGAGRFATDHNDAVFISYLCFCFRAWFEYRNSGQWKWLIWLGIFTGGAVLIKWLVGLLVLGCWGIVIVLNGLKRKAIADFLMAAGIALIVFLPWQIYIFFQFPDIALYEWNYNSAHIYDAVEGHDGDWMFHFRALSFLYGKDPVIPYLLLVGWLLLIVRTPRKDNRIILFSAVVVVYGFFAIAATKMQAFCAIVYPVAMLGYGTIADLILHPRIRFRVHPLVVNLIRSVVVIWFAWTCMNMREIRRHHTDWRGWMNEKRNSELWQMRVINQLSGLDKNTVVFNSNVRQNGHIAVMFYTDLITYMDLPTEEQLDELFSKGYKVAVVERENPLPGYILNRENIRIIPLSK